MTSSTTIGTTDTFAVTTASRTPSPGVVKHLRRIIATVVVGLCAILAVPGTALARTEPIGPDSGTVPIVSPAPYPTSAAHASSGWGLTTVLAVVVIAVLAVGLVLMAQRVARHRRDADPTALGA
jgi:hypothetical protein